MFIYYGKTFESSQSGGRIVGVVCDQCGCKYFYELTRIGTGANTASYWINESGAAQKAGKRSEMDLQRRLQMEAELVPCPQCNWINDELVKGHRLGRYRAVGKFAFGLGFAGSTLSLIAAWCINLGPPVDRWLLPYLLVGGPGVFASLAVAMLLLRRWLRGRIEPNRDFPREPRLPPGSPPALILDEATQNLRLAKPASPPADDILEFQFGRHHLPAMCCECLQTAATDHGHSINVTRLLHLKVPLCGDCARKTEREYQRISRIFAVLGLLVGGAMTFVMWRSSVEWWVIVVSLLLLLGLVAVLIAIVASMRTAPVKLVGADRSRGVVRLRFRNPEYLQVVAQQIEGASERIAGQGRSGRV